jgi:PilZ domain-containing protein
MSREKRAHVRRVIAHRARVESPDGSFAAECVMIDVSAGGARLILSTTDPLPDRFFLVLSHDGALRRLCEPMWHSEATAVGVQFILK